MKIENKSEKYYEVLRNMSGEQRMRIGFEMHKFVMKIVESAIRNQYPDISDAELKEKIKERLPRWNLKK